MFKLQKTRMFGPSLSVRRSNRLWVTKLITPNNSSDRTCGLGGGVRGGGVRVALGCELQILCLG